MANKIRLLAVNWHSTFNMESVDYAEKPSVDYYNDASDGEIPIYGDHEIQMVLLISKGTEDLHWLLQYESIIEVIPIPLSVAAVVSSLLAYLIALNMKSDQSSVTTLKYMALFDGFHNASIIFGILIRKYS